jgi:hypothetical protein
MLLHHFTAFFCTAAAFQRAIPAIDQLFGVALTLFGTGCTDLITGAAKQLRILCTNAHQPGRGVAHNGTLSCERNATGERFYVMLFQAFRSAMLTFGSTIIACINATSKSMIVHKALVYF